MQRSVRNRNPIVDCEAGMHKDSSISKLLSSGSLITSTIITWHYSLVTGLMNIIGYMLLFPQTD